MHVDRRYVKSLLVHLEEAPAQVPTLYEVNIDYVGAISLYVRTKDGELTHIDYFVTPEERKRFFRARTVYIDEEGEILVVEYLADTEPERMPP